MDSDSRRKKNDVGSKKAKNVSLNSSVGNTERPIISKTIHLGENLNDANRVLKIVKNAIMHFNQLRNIGCKTLRI